MKANWNRINKTDKKREKQGKVRFLIPKFYNALTGKNSNKRIKLLVIDTKLI